VHCNNPALKQEPATSTTSLANVRPAERLDVQRAFFMGLFRRLARTARLRLCQPCSFRLPSEFVVCVSGEMCPGAFWKSPCSMSIAGTPL
jgi:hypothetical protein